VLVRFDEFDDDLAEILTVQQFRESRAGIFETVHNVFAIANGAIVDTLCTGTREPLRQFLESITCVYQHAE
jgi:hypothetical protein